MANVMYRKRLAIKLANLFGIAPANFHVLSAYQLQTHLKVNTIFRYNKHDVNVLDRGDSHLLDRLEAATITHGFIQLIQDVYDIKGAWLRIQIMLYQMDEAESNATTDGTDHEAGGTTAGVEDKVSARSLLNRWKLGMYWS
eukprot:81430_1